MPDPSLPPEIDILLEKHLSGDLDEAEALALLRYFEEKKDTDTTFDEVAVQEAIVQKVLSHCLIGQYYLAEKPCFFSNLFGTADNDPGKNKPIPASQTAPDSADSGKRKKAKKVRQYKPSPFFGVSVFLLLFFFTWGIYHELSPLFLQSENIATTLKPVYFARITSLADARWADGVPALSVGQHIDDDDKLHLESGLAELTLRNGVVLILQGPTELGVASLKRCFCKSGTLSVHVPTEEGHGFEVATPNATVRDLGTRFVLQVNEEKTELHVVDGKVETFWPTRGWTAFPEGTGVTVFEDKPAKQMQADKSLFIGESVMKRLAGITTEKQVKAKENRTRRQAADPAMLLHWHSESESFRREGARFVAGPYPNEKAAEFHGKNDCIRIPRTRVTQGQSAQNALTLTASIRLDGLDRTTNTILATDRFVDVPGFCWNVDASGRMQLQVLAPDAKAVELYESERCFSPKLFGVWMDVAVTYDRQSKRVAFYRNGLPVSTHALKRDIAVEMDDLTLGNWFRRERAPVGRQFQGRIEHLSLFARALSDAEIENLYHIK